MQVYCIKAPHNRGSIHSARKEPMKNLELPTTISLQVNVLSGFFAQRFEAVDSKSWVQRFRSPRRSCFRMAARLRSQRDR